MNATRTCTRNELPLLPRPPWARRSGELDVEDSNTKTSQAPSSEIVLAKLIERLMLIAVEISRSIVESQGGRLWAAANSPRGANFYFTLPLTHRHRNDDYR